MPLTNKLIPDLTLTLIYKIMFINCMRTRLYSTVSPIFPETKEWHHSLTSQVNAFPSDYSWVENQDGKSNNNPFLYLIHSFLLTSQFLDLSLICRGQRGNDLCTQSLNASHFNVYIVLPTMVVLYSSHGSSYYCCIHILC